MQDRTLHVALITGLLSFAAGCALIWLTLVVSPADNARERDDDAAKERLGALDARYDAAAAKVELNDCKAKLVEWEKRWRDEVRRNLPR